MKFPRFRGHTKKVEKIRNWFFLWLLIFTPYHQIPILKAASSLIIHRKNTTGQQDTYRKEKTSESQSNNAKKRTEISLDPEIKD
jgi:hypothetical protein